MQNSHSFVAIFRWIHLHTLIFGRDVIKWIIIDIKELVSPTTERDRYKTTSQGFRICNPHNKKSHRHGQVAMYLHVRTGQTVFFLVPNVPLQSVNLHTFFYQPLLTIVRRLSEVRWKFSTRHKSCDQFCMKRWKCCRYANFQKFITNCLK